MEDRPITIQYLVKSVEVLFRLLFYTLDKNTDICLS
jgi:hypothetical protein